MTHSTTGSANGRGAKNRTCPEFFPVPVAAIRPAVVYDAVYGVTDPNDPSLDELASLMAAEGQVEPVAMTLDDVLLSGHRRRAVALCFSEADLGRAM